jgi:hypothetical protein
VHQQVIKGDNARKDKKPSLEGLKGSSAYVDAGATILAPHMPARWKNVPDNKFEIYGLKQRYAAPFAVEFDWVPDTGQLSGGRTVPVFDEIEEDEFRGGAAFPQSKKLKNNDGHFGKPKNFNGRR